MGEGRLFLVGTPIGNLEDITLRALRVLREVDLVAAEDTRRTRKLLSHYGIHSPLMSYRAANESVKAGELADEVAAGKKVALVSDAGMPGVSDPGFRVVEECSRRGLAIEVVPGPSSVSATLALSGLPLAHFHYEGFLPAKRSVRRTRLLRLLKENEPFLFFDPPHRLLGTLGDLEEMAGQRRLVVARELTKLHEEVLRGTPAEISRALADREPRGEFVVIVASGSETEQPALDGLADQVADLVDGVMRAREAVRAVAQTAGVSQREVYSAWLDKKETGRRG